MRNASTSAKVAGAIAAQLNLPVTTNGPHYPPADSVRGRVLGRLIRGSLLTSGDVWRELSSSRLASTIHQLKGFGWLIHSHRITVRTRDSGRDARISEYWLDSAQRKTIGDEGRNYAHQTALFDSKGI